MEIKKKKEKKNEWRCKKETAMAVHAGQGDIPILISRREGSLLNLQGVHEETGKVNRGSKKINKSFGNAEELEGQIQKSCTT